MRFRQWLTEKCCNVSLDTPQSTFEYHTSFEELPPELQQLKHVYWYLRKNAIGKSENPGYIAAYIHDFLKNKVASLKLTDGQVEGKAHQFNVLGSDENKWLIDGAGYRKNWENSFSALGVKLAPVIVKKLTDAKLHTVADVITALDTDRLPLNDIEKKTLKDGLLPYMLVIRPMKGLQAHTPVINPRFDPKLPGGELHLGD